MGNFDNKAQSASRESQAQSAAAPATGQSQFQTAPEQKQTQTDTSFAPDGFTGRASFAFDFETQESEESILRRMRSQAYLDIVASIDLLSSTDEEIIEKLKEVVDEETLEEFAEMSVEEMLEELRLSFEEEMAQRQVQLQKLPKPVELLGIISQCYIGGCDVHAINGCGAILEHFKIGCKMRGEFAFARDLYHKRHGNLRCIEIYSNACCVVASDGSVETIYFE